jgi:putative GTP pyrophosphokinase
VGRGRGRARADAKSRKRVEFVMAKKISKTQIDRLGDRLKKGNISEDDLRLLDQYRRSFTEAYEIVVGAIRRELALEPTGRPAKSTTSISDKLRRESIRLTQIQDIAGCRLIVTDIAEQDKVVQSLSRLFEHATVVDRRQRPSHGYRAVHVIVNCRGKLIEVQIRTAIQQLWAELSEKFSDVIDPAIKYGEGDDKSRKILTITSDFVAKYESDEVKLADIQRRISLQGDKSVKEQQLLTAQEELKTRRQEALVLLRLLKEHAEEL